MQFKRLIQKTKNMTDRWKMKLSHKVFRKGPMITLSSWPCFLVLSPQECREQAAKILPSSQPKVPPVLRTISEKKLRANNYWVFQQGKRIHHLLNVFILLLAKKNLSVGFLQSTWEEENVEVRGHIPIMSYSDLIPENFPIVREVPRKRYYL